MGNFISGALLLAAGVMYHCSGQHDWFSFAPVTGDMTMAQMTNEVIACVNFVGAAVIFARPK